MGGGVKLILAMPVFWHHFLPPPFPYDDDGNDDLISSSQPLTGIRRRASQYEGDKNTLAILTLENGLSLVTVQDILGKYLKTWSITLKLTSHNVKAQTSLLFC